MREDHISSAVAFLREPQVAAAPLAKRVEFLESKGLTTEEINEALRRAQEEAGAGDATTATAVPADRGSSPVSVTPHAAVPPRPSYMMQAPPPVPERDWKDYFVMATVSVGVAYGLYECARRYVLPMIMPPTPAALEADKEALEAEFERTEQLVKQLQEDTEELKKQDKVRTAEFTRVMSEAREVIDSIKEQNDERKQESKLALSNVETLRELIPRALKEHSETQAQAVIELQTELKSLKQLVSRRQTSHSPLVPPASSVPSSLPGFPRKAKPAAADAAAQAAPEAAASSAGAASASKPADEAKTESDAKPDTKPDAKPDSKPDASSSSKDDESAKDETFIPDPQAGIPAWQRAATSG